MVTESWLNEDISDSAVRIGCKFQVYWRDRQALGGGVLAYVNSDIPSSHLKHLENDDKEVLWLLLKRKRTPRPFKCYCCHCILSTRTAG
jgi:hypothetical protein